MSWKKHFKIPTNTGNMSPIPGRSGEGVFGHNNHQSPLSDVYMGHPNRISRYEQYEAMDTDSEVNAALDILAEFCTQESEHMATPFDVTYNEEPTDTEIEIIKEQLQQWCRLNKFHQRMFRIFRNTLKYGDQAFIRDPETFELYWAQMPDLIKIIVNENRGKEPEQYVFANLNPNFVSLVATQIPNQTAQGPSVINPTGASAYNSAGGSNESRWASNIAESPVGAEHVVHLSISEGLDANWPFGISVLENVFKTYKQKELLEDSIIIYRVQRAPERRAFYIDTGNMPSHLAMAFVERVKNEIHQRRIPTQGATGSSLMDATYNPLSMNEDFFFPTTADGRGSKVDVLQGGSNLGEIDDLKFFTNKLFRGLRIPSSYLPTGFDDGTHAASDGRVGTALIQEHRFNEYCKRLQRLIAPVLDREFKMFLSFRGFTIDSSLFKIEFPEPQNFAAYRQIDLDSQRISTFSNVADLKYISTRFALKRFMGLSEEEIAENEKLWREENINPEENTDDTSGGSDMRSAGVTPGGIESDIETIDDFDMDMDDVDIDDAGADAGADAEDTIA